MWSIPAGTPFHGEFSSANAAGLDETNSRFTLYGPSSTSAITLGASDQVIITDLIVQSGAALTVTVYDGANNVVAAGERIALGQFAANTNMPAGLSTPHFCQAGTYPKVLTSGAGQIDCLIRGRIASP